MYGMSIPMFIAIRMLQIRLEPQAASEDRNLCVIARTKTMYHVTPYSQENENEAPLKELTTVKPLSARQCSEKTRQRVKQRRELEEAMERKQASQELPWW